MLLLEALTVCAFASMYILISGAMEGVKVAPGGISRSQAERSFHDSTISQARAAGAVPPMGPPHGPPI